MVKVLARKRGNVEDFLREGTIIGLDNKMALVGWGKRSWLPSPSNQPSFFFPDFFLQSSEPWFVHEHYTQISLQNLLSLLPTTKIDSAKIPWQTPPRDDFSNALEKLKDHFKKGKLSKAVPYIFATAKHQMTQEQHAHSIRNIIGYALNSQTTIYGFWGDPEGMLGATPELLFKSFSGQKIKTAAIAGTEKNGIGTLLNDPKIHSEHHWVVQGIIESLKPFGRAQIGEPKILKLPKLSHLMTPIEVIPDKEFTFQDLVQALHPTPALGAYPRLQGMEWLKEYDKPLQRKRFGAPFGYSMPQHSACHVGIRNMQWRADEMRIGAGCGVVMESDPEAEWDELMLKMAAIKEILAV